MSGVRWHDVSIPLKPGMTVWPGDVEFAFTPAGRIAEGAPCNTSVITTPTHVGTHCDAPWHFEPEGKRLHEVDTQLYFGEARLIEVSEVDVIRADDLGTAPLPPRVLLKTRNAQWEPNTPFHTDYTGVAPDAAQRLVDEGVRLVGIDYLSVAPYKDSGPTHHILLQNEVFVVEGLVLRDFGPGIYQFVVLPMPIWGADGAPCRAFIGTPA